eukprot:CAMPEP_0115883128 /NCGR_PEP_ID=MMETSP0287-20121206/29396_1 /TAXON_ID=412157 /ORGANISM="Chrysochromulina rotalis, Strain UIO044" /LENGTH=130 /DNA_ID=CAMNT_0003339299 /DNA_START=130 /DNA_END=518 /DNA_ORIENTATION=-
MNADNLQVKCVQHNNHSACVEDCHGKANHLGGHGVQQSTSQHFAAGDGKCDQRNTMMPSKLLRSRSAGDVDTRVCTFQLDRTEHELDEEVRKVQQEGRRADRGIVVLRQQPPHLAVLEVSRASPSPAHVG